MQIYQFSNSFSSPPKHRKHKTKETMCSPNNNTTDNNTTISTTTVSKTRPDQAKKTSSSIDTSSTVYGKLGDALNLSSMIINAFLASATTSPTPNTQTSESVADGLVLDEVWKTNGFCVSPPSQNRIISTEIVCCLLLVSFAILHFVLYGKYYTKDVSNPSKNSQLVKMLQGKVNSNVSHGFGHLSILFFGGIVPSIALTSKPQDIGYIVMLYFFWMGALKASMTSLASSKGNSRIVSLLTVLSILIIAAQYCLNVPANMSFTYSQSVIFAAGALDQLFLLPKEEKFVDGGWTYFVHAASYLPLYLFYAIEMTSCSTTLASFGTE